MKTCVSGGGAGNTVNLVSCMVVSSKALYRVAKYDYLRHRRGAVTSFGPNLGSRRSLWDERGLALQLRAAGTQRMWFRSISSVVVNNIYETGVAYQPILSAHRHRGSRSPQTRLDVVDSLHPMEHVKTTYRAGKFWQDISYPARDSGNFGRTFHTLSPKTGQRL